MGSKKQHCDDCKKYLGESFEQVHKWLDEFASPVRGYVNINHRRYRHHLEALEEVRELFGDGAVEAAKRHIIMDFNTIPTKKEVEEQFPEEWELISFKNLKEGK